MTWLGYVFAGVMLTGAIVYQQHTETHPLAPWARVGSDPFITVVNQTPDTEAIFVQAPSVDRAWRFLGMIPPGDSLVEAKLPYADTDLLIRVAQLQAGAVSMNIYEPGVAHLILRRIP